MTEKEHCDYWIVSNNTKWLVNKNAAVRKPFYTAISNRYSTLPQYAPDPPTLTPHQTQAPSPPIPSKFKYKALCLAIECQAKCTLNLHEDQLIEQHIICAEDARTVSAKADATSPSHVAIDRAHSSSKTPYPNPILRKSINSSLALTTSLR